MSNTAIIEKVADGKSIPALPSADWDLVSALTNAKNYGEIIGAAVMGLAGVIVLIVAIVFVVKKLVGNDRGEQKSWLLIIAMTIVAGLLLFGGWSMIESIAEGGNTTINDLGGGFIVFQGSFGLIR